jgi:hypothetical protein
MIVNVDVTVWMIVNVDVTVWMIVNVDVTVWMIFMLLINMPILGPMIRKVY